MITWTPLPRYADDPAAYLARQRAHGDWLRLRGKAHGADLQHVRDAVLDLCAYIDLPDAGAGGMAMLARRVTRQADRVRAQERLADFEERAVAAGIAVRS